MRGPVVVAAAGDEPAWHDAVLEHAASAVDIGKERLQGTNPLGDTALDHVPLDRIQQAGNEVQRSGPFLTTQIEGDSGIPERPVENSLANCQVPPAEQPKGVMQGRVSPPRALDDFKNLIPRGRIRGLDEVSLKKICHDTNLR